MSNLFLLVILFLCSSVYAVHWPTEDMSFFKGESIGSLVQPTDKDKVETALFGCYRNNGKRFHEGIDIKPKKYSKKGEALDVVVSVFSGKVVHINKRAGDSSYGNCVIVEHDQLKPKLYTLYAHLSEVCPTLHKGKHLREGQKIGVMGRSANHAISKDQAHLHFEAGLKLSDNFQSWYNEKKFGSKNIYGNWNGMNLIGMDPLHFFTAIKENSANSLSEYIKNLPTAFKLRIVSNRVPCYIKNYPNLLTKTFDSRKLVAWDVEFTWYGLPKLWTPVCEENVALEYLEQYAVLGVSNEIFLVSINNELLKGNEAVKMFKRSKESIQLNTRLIDILKLLFKY